VGLVNWAFVEQRRVDLGITRADLGRRCGLHPDDLRDFDDIGASDGHLTLHQIRCLATVLDVPVNVLVRPELEPTPGETEAYYFAIGRYGVPIEPSKRFHGTRELDRWHAEPEQQHDNPAPQSDAKCLLCALFLADDAIDIGALAVALDWTPARLQQAADDLRHTLRRTGLRLRTHLDDIELAVGRRTLTPAQRQKIRMAVISREGLSPAQAAVLLAVHRRGPTRLDELHPQHHRDIAKLEQLLLIERLGARYHVTARVRDTLTILDEEPAHDGLIR
jgi:hypothetical protein